MSTLDHAAPFIYPILIVVLLNLEHLAPTLCIVHVVRDRSLIPTGPLGEVGNGLQFIFYSLEARDLPI